MPRAPKQCAKPGCRKAGGCEHTKAWKRSANQVELSSEFKRIKRSLRGQTLVCGVNLGTGDRTGDGCGERLRAPEIDHIIPRSRGGGDARSNLQGLCKPCHSAKTKRERGHPK